MNYEDKIKAAAEEKEDLNISNTSFQHAKVGIRYLLKNAETTVRLVSSEFYTPFWEQLIPDIQEFLNRDPKNTICILLLRSEAKNHPILKSLQSTGRVHIYVHKDDSQQLIKSDTESRIPNFMVVDPVGYRMELSDCEMCNSIVSGIINFGDTEKTRLFTTFFDLIAQTATVPFVA